MKIGYSRVSTDKQDTKAQEQELLRYGCAKDKIFFGDHLWRNYRKTAAKVGA